MSRCQYWEVTNLCCPWSLDWHQWSCLRKSHSGLQSELQLRHQGCCSLTGPTLFGANVSGHKHSCLNYMYIYTHTYYIIKYVYIYIPKTCWVSFSYLLNISSNGKFQPETRPLQTHVYNMCLRHVVYSMLSATCVYKMSPSAFCGSIVFNINFHQISKMSDQLQMSLPSPFPMGLGLVPWYSPQNSPAKGGPMVDLWPYGRRPVEPWKYMSIS